jgi:hypothetical protein
MNEDMEKKLDQLLADMSKRKYDLDAWLAEDETAEFDRIVSEQKMPEENAPANFTAKIKPLHRWLAAAACLILIIGIGVTLWPKEKLPTAPLTAQETEQPQTEPKALSLNDTIEQIRVADNDKQGESKPTPIEETAVTQEPAVTQEELNPVTLPDPNLHYAALTTTEDSVPYQDPARVDDYIFQLAEHYQVKQGELTCSQPIDSSVVSSVYVFPDKDEINLFSRLLQVACWYDSKAPGYHLNFSQQQFFFELKDMRRQLQYRWIAERINGRILFYSTQAPIGAKESSACYQQYRDELMYQNSINIKTKKI